MRILTLLFFVMAVFSIWATLSRTPAFSPSARSETLFGDGRIPAKAAMYDPGAYAFQRGYGFLAADVLFSEETESRDEVASPEIAEARALKAIAAFKEAVSLDPGNAYAWVELAWAHARLAEDTNSVEALRNSWRLAPNNSALAEMRVNLVSLLSDPELEITPLSENDYRYVRMDAETLQRFDQSALIYYEDSLPFLSELKAESP